MPESDDSKTPQTESGTKSQEPHTAKSSTESDMSAQELAQAEAKAKAASEQLKAAKAAVDAAMEEQYQKTAKELKVEKPQDIFTDKRSGDVIFRRELGEPEFWLDKKDRVPPRPVLTEDQQREISRQVEIPTNQIPKYVPKRILSKEFGGVSNYEVGLDSIRDEAEQKLERLARSGASSQMIRKAQEDLKKLDHLYENYHVGMNVFRTARGGRDKIKKQ